MFLGWPTSKAKRVHTTNGLVKDNQPYLVDDRHRRCLSGIFPYAPFSSEGGTLEPSATPHRAGRLGHVDNLRAVAALLVGVDPSGRGFFPALAGGRPRFGLPPRGAAHAQPGPPRRGAVFCDQRVCHLRQPRAAKVGKRGPGLCAEPVFPSVPGILGLAAGGVDRALVAAGGTDPVADARRQRRHDPGPARPGTRARAVLDAGNRAGVLCLLLGVVPARVDGPRVDAARVGRDGVFSCGRKCIRSCSLPRRTAG